MTLEFASSAQTAEAKANADRAKLRRSKLVDERAKLMQAHYAGAVPVDLLKTEMGRLTGALAEADTAIAASTASLDKIQANLDQALLVAANCQQQYASAPPCHSPPDQPGLL